MSNTEIRILELLEAVELVSDTILGSIPLTASERKMADQLSDNVLNVFKAVPEEHNIPLLFLYVALAMASGSSKAITTNIKEVEV